MDNHRRGLPGEARIGTSKRDMINGLLSTGTATARKANPNYYDLNPRGVIRSFRLDRLNDMRQSGRQGMWFDYDKVNNNRMPRRVDAASAAGAGREDVVGSVGVSRRVHEGTGLPLNEDGTVTLYHGTTKDKAARIREENALRSAAEPDVYLTTDPAGAGYGDGAVVAVRVKPDALMLDDEFPGGRRDFRVNVGTKKLLPVRVE
jgi:hypothetical protein